MKVRVWSNDVLKEIGRIVWQDGKVRMHFNEERHAESFSRVWNLDGSKILTPDDGIEFMQAVLTYFNRSSGTDIWPEKGDPIVLSEEDQIKWEEIEKRRKDED